MAAFTYEYRVNGLIKAPAQAVGELFETLEHSSVGLSPESVLNASRSEGTLLHDEFEWRDDVAAEKFRLRQAQDMIRNIRIVVEATDDNGEKVVQRERGFISSPGGKSAYVMIASAFKNDEWQAHLMEQARRDMEAFCAKYRRLEQLGPIIIEMETMIKQDA